MSGPEPMDSLPVSTPPLSPLPSIMIISPPSDLQSPTWNSPWTPNHMAPTTPQPLRPSLSQRVVPESPKPTPLLSVSFSDEELGLKDGAYPYPALLSLTR